MSDETPAQMAQLLRAQVACVEREVAMRRVVYPDRVKRGIMPQATADHELKTMQSVLESLKQQLAVYDPVLL